MATAKKRIFLEQAKFWKYCKVVVGETKFEELVKHDCSIQLKECLNLKLRIFIVSGNIFIIYSSKF